MKSGWHLRSALRTVCVLASCAVLVGGLPQPAAAGITFVSVTDLGYSPSLAKARIGECDESRIVQWDFFPNNVEAYSVTDSTGMGLFDSGLVPPGGTYTFTFLSAGKFPYEDSVTEATGVVSVPMQTSPKSGTTTTEFLIIWANGSCMAGRWRWRIQIRRPTYPGGWEGFLAKTGTGPHLFTPDAGPGTYSFRAKLMSTLEGPGGPTSNWSNPVSITVS